MQFHYANTYPFINELEPELVNAWLEIDLKAFSENLNFLKSKTPYNTKFMVIVKADAYGHGLIEIASQAEKNSVDYIGVANIAEAKILRQSQIKLPILVLGSMFAVQLPFALKYNIDVTLTSLRSILELVEAVELTGITANAHLKLDTGMGRLGIRPEKLADAVNLLKKSSGINLVGVYTHFSESENIDKSYSYEQLKLFSEMLEIINSSGFSNYLVHSANSSAILSLPESAYSMVRAGISAYGISEPFYANLKPVMRVRSRLINWKEVPSGQPLGYKRSFTTSQKSKIGVIPLGYADGLPRVLSNKQDVLIRGKRCRIVGNISMDQCLIDLTDVPEADIGDEIVLIGSQGNDIIRVEDWAEKSYRITYEVLCGFGNRLPRLYLD